MREEIIIPTTYCAPHFVLSIGNRARNGTETQMQGEVDKTGTSKRHRLVSDSSQNEKREEVGKSEQIMRSGRENCLYLGSI